MRSAGGTFDIIVLLFTFIFSLIQKFTFFISILLLHKHHEIIKYCQIIFFLLRTTINGFGCTPVKLNKDNSIITYIFFFFMMSFNVSY